MFRCNHVLQQLYTTPHTFSRFLSIIYNPKYSLYDEHTQQDWNDILLISTMWGFQELTCIALQHIDDIPTSETNNEGQATHIPSPANTEIEEPFEDEDMYVDEDHTSSAGPLSLGRPSVFREDLQSEPCDSIFKMIMEFEVWDFNS